MGFENINGMRRLPGVWSVLTLFYCAVSGPSHVLLIEAAPTPLHRLDMSHAFDTTTLYWPGLNTFQMEPIYKGMTGGGFWLEYYEIAAPEHGGTHLDAPRHFNPEGWSVDQIPLERLVAPAVVVDISARAANDSDAQLTQDDVRNWEQKHYKIPEGAIVFLNSGWDARWPNRTAVFGTDSDTGADLHFPGFEPDVVEWLVEKREIVGLGVDTPSIDHGPSPDFKGHQIMTSKNVYGLENVKNLGEVPVSGATVSVMPMKIGGGSGGPARIVATWGVGEPCAAQSVRMSLLPSLVVMLYSMWTFF